MSTCCRAYKLGKKRWLYNECRLILRSPCNSLRVLHIREATRMPDDSIGAELQVRTPPLPALSGPCNLHSMSFTQWNHWTVCKCCFVETSVSGALLASLGRATESYIVAPLETRSSVIERRECIFKGLRLNYRGILKNLYVIPQRVRNRHYGMLHLRRLSSLPLKYQGGLYSLCPMHF